MSEENIVVLPAAITANGSDQSVEIIPAKWEDAQGFAEYLMQYAAGVIMQRASAGKNDDAEKAKAAVDNAITRLQTGVVPAGGGFTKLTPEDYAMKETLTANKVKFEKGESVAACLLRVANTLTEVTEGETEEERELAVETFCETLQAELESSEVYKSALKARKAKAKAAAAGSLIAKL